jgi:tRNA(fMet)-specific endonuclease VapC
LGCGKMENDSYAYVGYLRGDTKVLNYLGRAECVYVSVFVMGELYAGFRAGDKEKENKQILERFLMKSTVSVLEASKETPEIFGLIKESLRKIGRPIPVNAVWIGAHALETGSVLLTYDRHFAFIPGLRLWDEL